MTTISFESLLAPLSFPQLLCYLSLSSVAMIKHNNQKEFGGKVLLHCTVVVHHEGKVKAGAKRRNREADTEAESMNR